MNLFGIFLIFILSKSEIIENGWLPMERSELLKHVEGSMEKCTMHQITTNFKKTKLEIKTTPEKDKVTHMKMIISDQPFKEGCP